MPDNQHILPSVEHYWSAVERAQRNAAAIDRLASMAESIRQSGRHIPPEAVARCHRAIGETPLLPDPAPGRFDHWTSQYLKFAQNPSFRNARSALIKLADQTAFPRGPTHDAAAAALFTAATIAINDQLSAQASEPSTDAQLAHFADAVIRTGAQSYLDKANWTSWISVALTNAAAALSAAIQDEPGHQRHSAAYDDHGRRHYVTRPHAMLTVAGRILTEAQHLHCADPASTTIINDARRSDHWLTQSARECSHNIIPDHTNYALATPAEFSPDQRRQLAQLAREIIRNAAVAPITPDWLFHAARHPRAGALPR